MWTSSLCFWAWETFRSRPAAFHNLTFLRGFAGCAPVNQIPFTMNRWTQQCLGKTAPCVNKPFQQCGQTLLIDWYSLYLLFHVHISTRVVSCLVACGSERYLCSKMKNNTVLILSLYNYTIKDIPYTVYLQYLVNRTTRPFYNSALVDIQHYKLHLCTIIHLYTCNLQLRHCIIIHFYAFGCLLKWARKSSTS